MSKKSMEEYARSCHAFRQRFNDIRTDEQIRQGRDHTMIQTFNEETGRWESIMPASHPDHPSWKSDAP